MSSHSTITLAIGLALIAIGLIPWIVGLVGTVGISFEAEDPLWKIGMVSSLLAGVAGAIALGILDPDTRGFILGGGALVLPVIYGIYFGVRFWEYAHRETILWAGGAVWILAGLGMLYLRDSWSRMVPGVVGN